MSKPLSVQAISELNRVLLLAAIRAERNNRIRAARHAEQLAGDIQDLCKELARTA